MALVKHLHNRAPEQVLLLLNFNESRKLVLHIMNTVIQNEKWKRGEVLITNLQGNLETVPVLPYQPSSTASARTGSIGCVHGTRMPVARSHFCLIPLAAIVPPGQRKIIISSIAMARDCCAQIVGSIPWYP